ncbi:branched-chain amino acid ABC transporter permease [Microbacterium sp. NPDC055910]|uniref:branched-chain amino acid ABC transporter permease n=1 Tax=Microbacterium sp. NPDC055910 TaxID=3345659 RepID=UPI0035E1F48F
MNWFLANIVLIQTTFTTALLALSLQIPMRAGMFSFAGFGAFGIGGYTAAIAMIHLGWPTYPAIALGVIVAAASTYVLGLLVRRLNGLYLGMATLAFTLIIAVIVVNGGTLTGGAAGLYGAVGDIELPQIALITVAVIAVVAYFETGRRGRRADAVREDPALAAAMGINSSRFRLLAFLASGAVGGLTGALMTLSRTTIAPTDINFHMIVLALTVIVVGGWGSWVGVAIGSVVFVWLPTWLGFVSEWEGVIYGFLVALAAVFLPDGVLGVIKSWIRKSRMRGRPSTVETSAIPSIRAVSGEASAHRAKTEGPS